MLNWNTKTLLNWLQLVTIWDGLQEGGRFLNEEKYLMTLKELNKEPYEVKISSTFI